VELQEQQGPPAEGWEARLVRSVELFEFAPDAYLITDLAGIVRQANRAAAVLLRIPKEFLVGKPLPFYVVEEDRQGFYHRLAQLAQGRAVPEWEARLQPNRSLPVEAALTVIPSLDQDGQLATLRWLLRDVSARKAAEAALRAEKEFADGVIDAAEALVLVLEAGQIVRVNTHTELMTGYTRDELLGRFWWDLLDGDDARDLGVTLLQSVAGSRNARGICALHTRSGPARAVQWSARLLPQEGRATAMLLVGHDITDLQEAQRQTLTFERLAAIGQMAAGLAHESRNAIQRSTACLNLLAWKLQDNPEELDLVERALRAQHDLLRLYQDVCEYAVPIVPESRRCDLGDIWREVWKELTTASAGGEPQVRLEERIEGTDLYYRGDPFRLAQVFRNVLENALAAAGNGARVEIACREIGRGGPPALEVAVCDNGPGLTEEQLQRMFEPFYTTKVRGTGLGLAIARRIVEAHGGQITADNRPGGGTEIVILLPRSES
jgi:PAS domain S-box-containing protein